MSTEIYRARAGAADFLADHRLLSAGWVAASSSAGGVFVARAVKARTARSRVRWAVLATFEFGIAIGIIRALVKRKSGEATQREEEES
jgi:hypothetical protein